MFSGRGIGKGTDGLFKVAIVGVIAVVILVLMGLYKGIDYLISDSVLIETKTLLKPPALKLSINGDKIDTTYIYKIPK